MRSVWIGADAREQPELAVAVASTRVNFAGAVVPIRLSAMRARGLYWRPTKRRGHRLWDVISEAPMATEFAISRFLVPHLTTGWALFMDCDVLVRRSLDGLFALADPRYAVMCVQHVHEPVATLKMDGQAQIRYPRKNWSSVCLWNTEHPANARLTIEMINKVPGRDLHRFCWLDDDEIGALPTEWNWLVGHSDPAIDPAIVHYTSGSPRLAGDKTLPYASEWRAYLEMNNGRSRRTA